MENMKDTACPMMVAHAAPATSHLSMPVNRMSNTKLTAEAMQIKELCRRYNVPLIIYSPLLKRPRHMESVVSHYDIAPSVTAYLKKNYSCKFPETTHYLGESLDTALRFVCNMAAVVAMAWFIPRMLGAEYAERLYREADLRP